MGEWTEEEIEHIEAIADECGVDMSSAYAMADLLGKDELYDGFVTAMEDAGMMFYDVIGE